MYSVSATLWAIDLKLMWNELKVILPGLLSSNIPVDTLGEMNHDLFFATDMISLVNFVFSDAVVLWRACVVWNLRKAVVCLAVCIFTCLIGACNIHKVVVYLLFVLSDIRLYFGSAAQSRVSVSNTTGNIILPILISLSLFINVWATSMVALRAWIHRRDIRRYLQSRTERSAVESGFMMLVESGIVYSIGMVLLMFAFIPSTSSGVFFTYWGRSVMNQVSGMYPTLVIVLVALQKSHRDHQFSFLDKGPDGTLPFSVRVPPSQSSARISAPGMHPSLQLGTAQGPSREDARVDPLDEA
ncbi:hypothetical protein OF83DRAFT_1151614, partial [Amylostereum chailletii]